MLRYPKPLRRSICLLALPLVLTGLVSIALPVGAVQTAQSVVVSDNPVDWTPHVLDGQVNAIAQTGTTVIVGGTFTQVQAASSQTVLTRNYLFAFDTATGAIDTSFQPQLNGPVETLAVSDDHTAVFAGGSFTQVNGSSVARLVKLNLSDGTTAAGFSANANLTVNHVIARDGWLYVGGKFTTIKATARSGLARVDQQTGAVDANLNLPFTDPPQATMSVSKFDITPNGSWLIAIGNFSRVAGVEHTQIAMLNLATTPVSLAPWHTDRYPVLNPNNPALTWCQSNFDAYVRDVDFAPDGSYFVVVTTGANRPTKLCDTAARWETAPNDANAQPSWVDWTGGDSIISVALTGTAVYVGGHNQYLNNPYVDQDCGVCTPGPGAVPRQGIAALDPINGLPYTWDPGRARGEGVFAFGGTSLGLWVGSDTDVLGGENHPKLGFFPVAGGTAVPPNQPYSLLNDLYNMPIKTGALLKRSFDGISLGPTQTVPAGIDWRDARGAFALNGKLYTGWSDGNLYVRDFDGTSVGPANQLDLHGLDTAPPTMFKIPGTKTAIPSLSTQLANATGMFFDRGRLYYTVAGDARLYYRYFTPESGVVGANLFVASTGDGVQWAKVRGMTMADGVLVFSKAGRLWKVAFSGRPTGAVTRIGTTTGWDSRGMFSFG